MLQAMGLQRAGRDLAAEQRTTTERDPGLPWWLSGKESAYQCRRRSFHPGAGKLPWRRKRQPTPVFLPGKSHGQKSLASYGSWGCKESDTT